MYYNHQDSFSLLNCQASREVLHIQKHGMALITEVYHRNQRLARSGPLLAISVKSFLPEDFYSYENIYTFK